MSVGSSVAITTVVVVTLVVLKGGMIVGVHVTAAWIVGREVRILARNTV